MAVPHPELDPDEVLIKAEYFLPIDPSEGNLRKVKDEITQILRQDGFRQVDVDLRLFGPTHRTMTFQYDFGKPEPPLLWKVKDQLGLAGDEQISEYYRDYYFEKLGERRVDIPFEIDFRFRTGTLDGEEGYIARVTAVPTLLQQYKQGLLPKESDFDVQTVVRTTKREVEKIFDKIGATPISFPYTEAEDGEAESNANQSERERTFLQIRNIHGPFYPDLVQNINRSYDSEIYDATLVLTRKLLENLLIDILRERYGTARINLYYEPDSSQFQNFNTLIRNFDKNQDDFKHFSDEVDDDLIRKLDSFRQNANAEAHSIHSNLSESEIESYQADAEYLTKVLLDIHNKI